MTARDTLHFLTCGHVDDGKSTLIGRLLFDIGAIPEDQVVGAMIDGKLDYSRLTDGLEDERAQGITIDVAYRYFRYEGRHFRIADTPGHVQYVRNMAVAAANSDCALILVDASHGVREQTIRHSRIAAFFGIRHFIIAVNKMDLVEYSEERFKEITAAYQTAMQEVRDIACTFIPVSAIGGDNLTKPSAHTPWYRGYSLIQQLREMKVPEQPEYGVRLPVQYVIRTPDTRRAYQGVVSGGTLRVGDVLGVADSSRTIRVSTLYHSGKEVQEAKAGSAVTVCSEDDVDIARGNVLYAADTPIHFTDAFMSDILWLDPSFREQDCVQGLIKIHHREEQAELRVQPAASETALQEAQVYTASPVAYDAYARDRASGLFLVIEQGSEKVIGVGAVRTLQEAEISFSI